MKTSILIFSALALLFLAACAAPTPAPTARPPSFRIELPSDPEISDIPRLMAADALRAQGYNVEPLDFQDNNLSAQALQQGDLDVGFISNPIAWTAIQKGANLVTIVDDVVDTRVLVTAPSITQCSDLNGKRIALPSLNSTQTLVLNQYIKTNCPGTTYESILIPNQTGRLVALTKQEVQAATVAYTNVREMERDQNIKIPVLVQFAKEFPQLRGASEVASKTFVQKYPQAARDLIRALLEARRQIQDRNGLAEQIVKYLKMDPAEANAAADIYLGLAIWDLNGGYTPETVAANIKFFEETGGVAPGLKPEDVSDLSYLNQVLAEIGKK